MPYAADQNLLFGILALQMEVIDREQLIDAMHRWVKEKGRALGELLVESKAIDEETYRLLEGLMRKRIELHQGDVQGSLASFAALESSLKEQLLMVNDRDVARTVSAIPPTHWIPPDRSDLPGSGNRFSIVRFHAEGGLGEVYVAEDLELHRDVALKRVKQSFAQHGDSRSRFLAEAEITAGLEHPNIVPVYGLGVDENGRPYYAMKFIRGESLRKRIDEFHFQVNNTQFSAKERSLGLRKLLGNFVDVCQAVEYAHSRGVIHRDLKPSNVMLGRYGETLVVDWGLAKAVGRDEEHADAEEATLKPSSKGGSSETVFGQGLGTLPFASPEQLAGRWDMVGPASDVYSLGATLYVLLTGQPAFKGTQQEILDKVMAGVFPRPRTVTSVVPAALDAICVKAMSYRPESRYRSPTELAEEIGAWLADEAVEAYADPLPTKVRRWLRRHRGLAAGSTAAVVVALAGLAIGLALLSSKNQELAHVNTQLEGANSLLGTQNIQIQQQKNQVTLERDKAQENYETATRLSANLAARRGQWNEVLRVVDRAIAEEHHDPVGLRLERVKALYGLIHTEECRQEIEALYKLEEKSGHEAEIDLWYGDMALLQDNAGSAKEHIERSLAAGLAPAEDAYARSLLESNTSKVIGHLQTALERDAFHQRAYQYLIANLIMLGRREEAREKIALGRTLFPDDGNFVLLNAWLLAMNGDSDNSIRILQELQPVLEEGDYRLAERLFRGLSKFVSTMDHWERPMSATEVFELGKLAVDFVLMSTTGMKAGKTEEPLSLEFRPSGTAVAAYTSLLKTLTWHFASLFRVDTEIADELTKTAAQHPDGLLHFIRGLVYFNNHKLENAREAFVEASELPAIIPNVQREALYCLCMTEQGIFLETEDEQHLHAALDALRRRLQHGPMASSHASIVMNLCLRMNEFKLARTLIDEQLEKSPDSLAWQLHLAEVERREENLLTAIRIADQVLAQEPENEKAQKLRNEALDSLDKAHERLHEPTEPQVTEDS